MRMSGMPTCAAPPCIAGVRSGYPVYPVLSTQGLVSCGSYRMSDDCLQNERNRPYTGGCGGGTSLAVMLYLRDHGLTWASCYPYELVGTGDGVEGGTGGGAVNLKDLPECRTSCAASFTERYPTIPMTFFKGVSPRSYLGEKQMKEAIMEGGPIYCGMLTWLTFSEYDDYSIYTVELGSSTKNYINEDGGAHAVVIYGWGVEMADEWTMSDVRHTHPAPPVHAVLSPHHWTP